MARADAMRSPALRIFSRLPPGFPPTPTPMCPISAARLGAALLSHAPPPAPPQAPPRHYYALRHPTCRAVTPSSLARRAGVDAEFFLLEARARPGPRYGARSDPALLAQGAAPELYPCQSIIVAGEEISAHSACTFPATTAFPGTARWSEQSRASG
ncbi:hypothetical protein PAHAL_5G102400 [Panicum hallii]|uniref:Uncharacterized protein n=1 Tax=Panicum hallii TaxID=206008 RepID=A0A2T8IJI5_9POAL|nr:hypothetical protein PAHAL_5G102400 [Panicum hallii]